jgi:hypothetical protein
MTISNSIIDQLHSSLLDDDQFNEAVQRITFQIAEEFCANQPCETDEEDVYDLAMELCTRIGVV